MQERVAFPDPVTLVGVTVHAELSSARPTTPLKPLKAVTVIVEVVVPPLDVTEVGLALIAKSTTWKVMPRVV